MILNLVFVLLISSVVIASGSSCDNVGNVTAQDAKYLKFNGGFFYIHGLTNGESVVMYKTPDVKSIHVQYTFNNFDCLYETRNYTIIENGTFVDHTKVLQKRGEFSIRKTLSFVVDGKDVELIFEITESGFIIVKGIEGTSIKTFEVKLPENTPVHATNDVVSNNISEFEFIDKESIELTDMNDGRLFYQHYSDTNSIDGSYVFKTSSGDYYTVNYAIENPFQDNSLITLDRYEIKDTFFYFEILSIEVKFQKSSKFLIYFFDSTSGLTITTGFSLVLSAGGAPPTNSLSRV